MGQKGVLTQNLTYTCMAGMIPRGQYIIWKNTLREGIRTSKQLMLRRKSYKIKNLACFKGKLIVIFVLIHLKTLSLIVFLLKLI